MTSSLTPCLLDQDNLQAAQAFAIRTRQLLFPEVYQNSLPHDLTHFGETYVVSPMGACFIIKTVSPSWQWWLIEAMMPDLILSYPAHV